jgi:hypothetical protein
VLRCDSHVTFRAYRYISEGNAFFPALKRYQQQQQQQPSPYAQTVQEAVAGELPSGASIAVADTRVDDIKVGGGGCTVFEIANAD